MKMKQVYRVVFGVEETRSIQIAGSRNVKHKDEWSCENFDEGWVKKYDIFRCDPGRATHVKLLEVGQTDKPSVPWIPIASEKAKTFLQGLDKSKWYKPRININSQTWTYFDEPPFCGYIPICD